LAQAEILVSSGPRPTPQPLSVRVMGASFCTSRQGDDISGVQHGRPRLGGASGSDATVVDEDLERFFECVETEEELALLCKEFEQNRPPRQLWALSACYASRPAARMQLVPEEAEEVPEEARADQQTLRRPPRSPRRGCQEAVVPPEVVPPEVFDIMAKVRQGFQEAIEADMVDEKFKEQLQDGGFPELDECTAPEVAARYHRAALGNVDEAVIMLTRAIKCRVRDRQLFSSMTCDVHCDARVIGRDRSKRPVIYVGARSQDASLAKVKPQILLVFEAAARLTTASGQFVMVLDMHGFMPRYNVDLQTYKDLAESFGTINADRLNYILLVDFSGIFQALWKLLQPVLTDRTRKKINFSSGAKARTILKERVEGPAYDRISSALDINRSRTSTAEERKAHARRTAICDVPLGVCEPNAAG